LKLLISWSGSPSKEVAQLLSNWLRKVIQAVKPWVSTDDIARGARWQSELSRELQDTNACIVCVTPDNVNAQWLNFEAGAVSKAIVEHARVCPYLIGMRETDLTGPLAAFQAARADREGTLAMVRSMNEACAAPINVSVLESVFDKFGLISKKSLRTFSRV